MSKRSRAFWFRLAAVLTGVWIILSGLYWTRELTFCGLDDPYGCLFLISPKDSTGYLYAIADWLGFGSLGLAGNALAWIVLLPLLFWILALLFYRATLWVSAANRAEAVE